MIKLRVSVINSSVNFNGVAMPIFNSFFASKFNISSLNFNYDSPASKMVTFLN